MNEQEFKQNTFKVLGMIVDIYFQNTELKKHFDLWITESTENGSDQISLTVNEMEI